MEHSLPLISTLVIGFMLALVFGFIAERFLKAPALVGYLPVPLRPASTLIRSSRTNSQKWA